MNGFTDGNVTYLNVWILDNLYIFATSNSFLSILEKPVQTEVTIIGRDIKTETKTGTEFDVKINIAIKIMLTTGVILIIERGIEKNDFKLE